MRETGTSPRTKPGVVKNGVGEEHSREMKQPTQVTVRSRECLERRSEGKQLTGPGSGGPLNSGGERSQNDV